MGGSDELVGCTSELVGGSDVVEVVTGLIWVLDVSIR